MIYSLVVGLTRLFERQFAHRYYVGLTTKDKARKFTYEQAKDLIRQRFPNGCFITPGDGAYKYSLEDSLTFVLSGVTWSEHKDCIRWLTSTFDQETIGTEQINLLRFE